MNPLKIIETEPGNFSLLLNAGEAASDATIESLGHEPGGYFWEGVATFLMKNHPGLEDRVGLDPEAGMFCAYGVDRPALEQLGHLMAPIANDPSAAKELIEAAIAVGHGFDD